MTTADDHDQLYSEHDDQHPDMGDLAGGIAPGTGRHGDCDRIAGNGSGRGQNGDCDRIAGIAPGTGESGESEESDTDDDRPAGHYLANAVTTCTDGVANDPVFVPCFYLVQFAREELERMEATGPRPSLHACGHLPREVGPT